MLPEEFKTQSKPEETTVSVEPVATEPVVDSSEDPIEEAIEKIQPETIPETQTSIPEEPTLTSEQQPQIQVCFANTR